MINKLTNLNTIEELYERGYDSISALPGIYAKIYGNRIFKGYNLTSIKEHNREGMLYNVNDLKSKFSKSDMNILYIGKAGGKNYRLRQMEEPCQEINLISY